MAKQGPNLMNLNRMPPVQILIPGSIRFNGYTNKYMDSKLKSFYLQLKMISAIN